MPQHSIRENDYVLLNPYKGVYVFESVIILPFCGTIKHINLLQCCVEQGCGVGVEESEAILGNEESESENFTYPLHSPCVESPGSN